MPLKDYLKSRKSKIDYQTQKALAKELDELLKPTKNTNEGKAVLDKFGKEHNLSIEDTNDILSIIVFGGLYS